MSHMPSPRSIRTIGILTGGGDAPGLNAVIRAVTLTAQARYGWRVLGIREGFDGLLNNLPVVPLDEARVFGLHARGGTVLGAANRGSPFARPVTLADGTEIVEDVSHEALARLDALGIDALVVAGGDGTLAIAQKLVQQGARIVGVPKTIDNDLSNTDVTFGFDTALQIATEALDRLQTTAESHHRVMVLEVMGRHAGWIALTSGVAGGADAILLPERPFDIMRVVAKIRALRDAGRRHSLVVVAEGAHPQDGAPSYGVLGDGALYSARLGGMGYMVGNMLADQLEAEVRVTVLGHVQRGGQPTPRDRWLGTRFGAKAVDVVAEQRWGTMVALRGRDMVAVPFEEALRPNIVDADGELVRMARDLGIVLG